MVDSGDSFVHKVGKAQQIAALMRQKFPEPAVAFALRLNVEDI